MSDKMLRKELHMRFSSAAVSTHRLYRLMPSSVFKRGSDQVIEVAIWKPLDIEIYRRAFDPQLRIANDVYFSFSERQGF